MDRHALVAVIEPGDEFQSRAKSFEVLTERRDSDIVGMFELRDRALGHLEASGQRGLAHGLPVAEFVEADLLERLGARPSDSLGRTRTSKNFLAEFGRAEPCINPYSR